MSKRFNSPKQYGNRKKPRLDISVSDHNFPLSQNAGSHNATDQNDKWDDEIDDEMLLQASQACEQACNSSMLPEYSQFRPPVVTSTQVSGPPAPSVCRESPRPPSPKFSFKIPSTSSRNTVSTQLKDQYERTSSPLQGLSINMPIEQIDLTGTCYNEPVVNTRDANYVYRQLLKLKEENAKLKSENSKLHEKCVTKEGESSILRTQLKTYQVAVDNARLDKIKAQEQAQIQWSEKWNAANNQVHELRTQLDFKNMEILSVKERCKVLESSKIKLTQITVAGNDISSPRLNNNMAILSNFQASQLKKPNTASCSIQTDNKPQFLKLTKSCRIGIEHRNLKKILPLIMDSATDQQYSILDYNEKLKRPTDFSPNKCRIFNTFHKPLPSTNNNDKAKLKINISCIYEDLTCIASSNNDVEQNLDHFINIINTTKLVLEDVQFQLENIKRRITSSFLKEMDKKYLECTAVYITVGEKDLIGGNTTYSEEQGILARRLTAVLQVLTNDPVAARVFWRVQSAHSEFSGTNEFVELLSNICTLLDNTSCGVLYSGLLLSVILFIGNLTVHFQLNHWKALDIMKRAVSARAMLFLPGPLLDVLNKINTFASATLCSENAGNLKVDYDQGVLLYKKESCWLQVLLKQVESSLKCMEKQNLSQQVVQTAQRLLQFYSTNSSSQSKKTDKCRCECERILLQVLVYALNICSIMLQKFTSRKTENQAMNMEQGELLRVCRSGLQILYQCTLTDVEFTSQLSYNEGNLIQFCEHLKGFDHNEFHSTMLSELLGSLQLAADDAPGAAPRCARPRSLAAFARAD